jgi:hypothetical protein
MAFETGTTTSQTDFFNKVVAFATAHGWTATGTGPVVLNNANGYVRLTKYDAQQIRIEGCNDNSFASNPFCAQLNRIFISNWPVTATYYAFALSSPDMIWVVLQYLDVGTYQYKHQYLSFGDAESLAGFVGGNWFAGTHSLSNYDQGKDGNINITSTASGSRLQGTQNVASGTFFWDDIGDDNNWDGGFAKTRIGYMHIEVDGHIWPGSNAPAEAYPAFATGMNPMHNYVVSNFDEELCLLPYLLTLRRPDGNYSDVAYLPHIRMAKLDNWSSGDIVTVDGESWMLFSWMSRDEVNPGGGYGTAGLWGYAIRYDGP